MIQWTPWILAVLGLPLLWVEFWATRLNRRIFHDRPRRTRLVYTICTSVAGVLLVYGSLYPEYYLRPDLRIFGVPFMTTAWQFERGRWIDYTGFLTLPALLGNALAAFLLPQLFVLSAKHLQQKERPVLGRFWKAGTGNFSRAPKDSKPPSKKCGAEAIRTQIQCGIYRRFTAL